MRDVGGQLTHGDPAARRVSRQQLVRGLDREAGLRAERLRRRENVIHALAVARRRRRRRLVTRLTWDPSVNWDDVG